MSIGNTLRKLRKSEGLSQKDFGKIAGVSDSSISAWEKGLKEPRITSLAKIAAHFGLDLQTLLTGTLEKKTTYQLLTPGQKRLMEAIPHTEPKIIEQLESYLRFLQNDSQNKITTK